MLGRTGGAGDARRAPGMLGRAPGYRFPRVLGRGRRGEPREAAPGGRLSLEFPWLPWEGSAQAQSCSPAAFSPLLPLRPRLVPVSPLAPLSPVAAGIVAPVPRLAPVLGAIRECSGARSHLQPFIVPLELLSSENPAGLGSVRKGFLHGSAAPLAQIAKSKKIKSLLRVACWLCPEPGAGNPWGWMWETAGFLLCSLHKAFGALPLPTLLEYPSRQ